MKLLSLTTLPATLMSSLALMTSLVLLSASPAPARAAEQTFITIGTGAVTGVYYVAGGAICRLVNQGRKEHSIRCSVESTNGSIANIDGLRAEDITFGISQSDWQSHAYKGSAQFGTKGPFSDLRAVFSLYPEVMTLVVRKDANIHTLADLKGKRVNIGNAGSGARATVDIMLAAAGINPRSDFSVADEFTAAEQSQALCDGKVDAIFFMVGHPSGTIKEATTACDSELVSIDNPGIEKLVKDNPFYSWSTIPGGMYRGSDKDVKTFGVRATLLTTAKIPDPVVYQLVKSVFDNFEDFKRMHPSFEALKKEDLINAARTAPLHPGAQKYYREAGLMK